MSGLVKLNGAQVYAFVAPNGDGALIRVSADEWERLGLIPGQQVRAEVPGQAARVLLLAGAEEIPPVVWLRLESLSARRAG